MTSSYKEISFSDGVVDTRKNEIYLTYGDLVDTDLDSDNQWLSVCFPKVRLDFYDGLEDLYEISTIDESEQDFILKYDPDAVNVALPLLMERVSFFSDYLTFPRSIEHVILPSEYLQEDLTYQLVNQPPKLVPEPPDNRIYLNY